MVRIGLAGALVFALTLIAPAPSAAAVDSSSQSASWVRCRSDHINDPFARYEGDVFQSPHTGNTSGNDERLAALFGAHLRSLGIRAVNADCKRLGEFEPFQSRRGNTRFTRVPNFNPETAAAVQEGSIRTASISYRPSNGRGYQSADIDLQYRFLVCDGEVHFAYSLIGNSVSGSRNYEYEGNFYPIDIAPPEQASVSIRTSFRRGVGGPIIGHPLEDTVAAPALGFGCYTGQTHKVGILAELVRGRVTPASTSALLNDLMLAGDLRAPVPLINGPFERRLRSMTADTRAGFRVNGATGAGNALARAEALRAEDEARAARDQAARAGAAVEAAEQQRTATLNRDILQRDQAVAAQNEANRLRFEQEAARHQAELARLARADADYRQRLAEHAAAVARAAQLRRAWEACVAGDRTQCAAGGR